MTLVTTTKFTIIPDKDVDYQEITKWLRSNDVRHCHTARNNKPAILVWNIAAEELAACKQLKIAKFVYI